MTNNSELYGKSNIAVSKVSVKEAEIASVKITKLLRGFIQRRRFRLKRLEYQRDLFQRQFETLEALQRYKFESYGATLVLQRFFRKRLRIVRKRRWHRKYTKMIIKMKRHALLFRAIQKCNILLFVQDDLDVRKKCRAAARHVLQRITRGFLGRRRYHRALHKKQIYETKKDGCAVTLQAFFRRCLVILHHRSVGYRYRNKLLKQRLYNSNINQAVHQAVQQDVDSLPEEWSMGRRESFLFPHLRLGTLVDLESILLTSAILIQCYIRRTLAKRIVRLKLHKIHERAARRLQKWWLGRGWRRKLRKSLRKIQRFWKQKGPKMKQIKESAAKIQAIYRGYIVRKKLSLQQRIKQRQASRIATFLSYRHHVHANHKHLQHMRSKQEVSAAGSRFFELTRVKWLAYYTWNGAKKTKNVENTQHELQRIFAAHCLNNGLDLSKITKILRECKGLLDDNLTPNSIELQFARVKSSSEKRIDYAKFLELLANVAVIKFLRVEPSKSAWETNTAAAAAGPETIGKTRSGSRPNSRPSSPARDNNSTLISPASKKRPLSPSNNSKQSPAAAAGKDTNTADTADTAAAAAARGAISLPSYRYGGLIGKPAFITRLLITYLSTLPDWQRAVEYLSLKSAVSQMERTISRAVNHLQSFARNRLAVKLLTRWLKGRKQQKIEARIFTAATRIQSMIKSFLGRRLVMRIAQHVYAKYVDGETESEYWYNSRTKQSFWMKPVLLGIFDCGMAVRMPIKEELLVVNCSVCEASTAIVFCQQCESPHCTACYVRNHQGGARRLHTHVIIDNCVQCDFQVGTRKCLTCADIYCDSCFKHVHKRGRLRFHAFERFTAACDECQERSAQWREIGLMTGKQSSRLWCTLCYTNDNSSNYANHTAPKEKRPTRSESGLEKIKFFGRQVTSYLANKAINSKKKEIEDAFIKRKLELAKQHRLTSLTTIQRVYRGYRTRLQLAPYIAHRKEMMTLRLQEDQIRYSVIYQVRVLLGIPPALASDTPLERVKKMYPWYLHHIIGECIEQQWSEAVSLLIQHEQHLQQVKNANFTAGSNTHYLPAKLAFIERFLLQLESRVSLFFATRKYKQVEKKVTLASQQVEAAAQRFHNAELSGILKPAKLNKMKAQVNALEKKLQKQEEALYHAEEYLLQAENHRVDCVGPRGLQTLIAERRASGVPLPFKVSIRHNSRLALVEYIIPEPANDDDHNPAEQQEEEEEERQRHQQQQQQMMPRQQSYASSIDSSELNETTNLLPPPRNNHTHHHPVHHQPKPGDWRRKLRTGDRIFLMGAIYTVSTPFVAVKNLSGVKKKKGKKSNTSSTAAGGSADDSSIGDDNSSLVTGEENNTNTNKSEGAEEKKDNDKDDNDDDDSQASNKKPVYVDEKELFEPLTIDHITLDRPWLRPDSFAVSVSKQVPFVFYIKPIRAMQRVLTGTYPLQKMIAVMAINWHKISDLLTYSASFFDDESDLQASVKALSLAATEHKYGWLSLSRSIVQMNYDFTLRRRAAKQVHGMKTALISIGKLLHTVYETINAATTESQYEYWQRSMDKVELRAFLELSRDKIVELGKFKMDLAAPVEVMREYVYRAFREKLNESVGESFLFIRIDTEAEHEEILPRDDEFKTFSKGYAIKRNDPKTFEQFMAVTIIRDADRARVFIPEFEKKADVEGGGKGQHDDDSDAEIEELMNKATTKKRKGDKK